MKYVVDASIINNVVDEKIDPSELPTDGEFIASHIQIDELNKTKNAGRRAQLLKQFVELDAAIVQTESIVLGSSKFGFAKFDDGLTVQALKSALDARNHGKMNNANDALIGELAIKKGFTLLTADRDLNTVVESHGGQVRYWKVKDLTIPTFLFRLYGTRRWESLRCRPWSQIYLTGSRNHLVPRQSALVGDKKANHVLILAGWR